MTPRGRAPAKSAPGAALALALLGGVSGCVLEPTFEWIPADGAHSVLLIEVTPAELKLSAQPLDAVFRWTYEGPRDGPLYVLGYEQTLSELGLEAGPVRLDPQGRPVPTPTWARAWAPKDEPPRFRPFEGVPPEASELKIAGEARCPRLSAQPVTVAPSPRQPYFLAAIDGEQALLGTDRGIFVVRSSTIALLRDLSPHAAYSGLYVPALGAEVYLARDDGQVFRGRPGLGFTPVTQLPRVAADGLAGFGQGEALVLFSVSSTSAVHRWSRGPVETLPVLLDPSRGVRLSAFGPRSVALYRGGRQSVVEVTEWPSPARELRLELQPDDELRGLRAITGVGPVLATRNGLALRRTADGWELLWDSATATTPFVLEQAFGGTLVGGEDAVLGLRLSDGRECGSVSFATAGQDSFKASASVGEVVYVIDFDPISPTGPMVRIEALK